MENRLKGGSCRVFKDKGYSGKNTDRPEFQKLLGEIRKGKVRRVIVYPKAGEITAEELLNEIQ